MASDPQQQSPPKKRRQWRRVLVRVFGVLLLAIIVWILAILPDDDLVPPGELRLASEPVPNELNAAWQLSALGKRIQGPVVYRLSNEFWIERDSSDEPDLATHGDVLNHVRSKNEPLIADIRGALKLDRWYIPFEVTDEFIAGVADIGEYLLVSELIAMERGDVDAGLSIFSLSLRMVHLAIAGAQGLGAVEICTLDRPRPPRVPASIRAPRKLVGRATQASFGTSTRNTQHLE